MHVALRGRDPRVPEELLHEPRVGVPRNKAPGGMTEGVEAQRAQAGNVDWLSHHRSQIRPPFPLQGSRESSPDWCAR